MKTYAAALFASLFLFSSVTIAAPYAAIVINAEDGKVLHCEECDTISHPAGLTKLLTLYVVFSKIERGEFALDDKVTVSRKASAELGAKLGLLPQAKKLAFVT